MSTTQGPRSHGGQPARRTPLDAFTPFTVTVLRIADRRLRTCSRGDMITRYAACRSALAALNQVDTFYVGHYLGPTTLSIPYCVDNKQFLSADVQQFGPHGMSQFIRGTGQVYRFEQDGGRKIRLGWDTGDHEVRDAVVIPLVRPENAEVIGMMCVESTSADTYDEEFVRAMQWLGRALVWEMTQDRKFADDLELYELYPELNSRRPRNDAERLRALATDLEAMRMSLHQIELPDLPANEDSRRLLDEARNAGERLHLLMVDSYLLALEPMDGDGRSDADPAAALTARELEVAMLVAEEGLTNRQLARRLAISEKTVKVHVGNVLRKLGIAQRSAIPFVIHEFGGSADG